MNKLVCRSDPESLQLRLAGTRESRQGLTQAVGVVVAAEGRAAADEVHHRGGRRRQLPAVPLLPPQVQAYAALDAAVNEGAVLTVCRAGRLRG